MLFSCLSHSYEITIFVTHRTAYMTGKNSIKFYMLLPGYTKNMSFDKSGTKYNSRHRMQIIFVYLLLHRKWSGGENFGELFQTVWQEVWSKIYIWNINTSIWEFMYRNLYGYFMLIFMWSVFHGSGGSMWPDWYQAWC